MTSTSSLGSTAITVQFDLERNIDAAANDIQAAINAAGGQLPKDLPSPPTYRKVNPADSPILLLSVLVGHLAAHRRSTTTSRTCSPSRSARSPASPRSRSAASRSRLSAFSSTPRSSSRRDCPSRTSAPSSSVATVEQPQGQRSIGPTRASPSTTNDQLTAGQGLERRHPRLSQWGAAAGARHRSGGDGTQDTTQAAWADGKRGVFLIVFKQPGANVINTVDAIKASCRACRPPSRRRSRSAFCPTAPRPSAPPSTTSSSRSFSPSRSW